MAGEDQERLEDFLALERYIEALQAGRVAHAPAELTPDLAHAWVAEAGEFEVLVGSSSQEIQATATFTLTATSCFGGSLEREREGVCR